MINFRIIINLYYILEHIIYIHNTYIDIAYNIFNGHHGFSTTLTLILILKSLKLRQRLLLHTHRSTTTVVKYFIV